MGQSGLSDKINQSADGRFTRKTYARKANPLANGPNSSPSADGSSNRNIFALLASLTVGSHLFFGSLDKVGRSRDLQNLSGRFADNYFL